MTIKKYNFFKKKSTREIVDFIEKTNQIKVRKIIAKYIIDINSDVIFSGIYSLFIDIPRTCMIKKIFLLFNF
jgi:hypothetical protein